MANNSADEEVQSSVSVYQYVFPLKSYAGRGAIQHLEQEVLNRAPSRILLVADPILVQLGVTARIAMPIREAGIVIDIFQEVTPEPDLALGERLVETTRSGNYDMVLGLGGGSALDLAKLAAVLAVHEGPVADYLNLTGTRSITKKGIPKILIPTTSGTGSEVTDIAVLSLGHTKDVVTHRHLLADVAIIEPDLTLTVPPRVTAATGIDALTHAIEAYLSVHANPLSDALALQAVKLAGRSLVPAVQDGRLTKAREEMSMASYLAGIAFFHAGVAGVHALAYPLGGQFHLPHGEANAVLLPYVMAYIRHGCAERMKELYIAMGGDATGMNADEASRGFIAQLRRLPEATGLPNCLAQYDIPASAIKALAQDAVKQSRLLARSPVKLLLCDIETIYGNAWHNNLAGEAAPA